MLTMLSHGYACFYVDTFVDNSVDNVECSEN